jgi:hypothetical protein
MAVVRRAALRLRPSTDARPAVPSLSRLLARTVLARNEAVPRGSLESCMSER